MEQTNNEPKSFVFHPSYYDTINTLWGEWPGWNLFQAICNCWMYDDYTTDFDDQTLKVLMQVIIPTMKSAKKRRDANIENWKKWWRPKKDWDIHVSCFFIPWLSVPTQSSGNELPNMTF